jgi:hypothetical protein
MVVEHRQTRDGQTVFKSKTLILKKLLHASQRPKLDSQTDNPSL